MKLRTALFSTAALALAATGSFLGVAATSASAAPPVHHTINTTSLLVKTQHIGPNVTIYNYNEYQPLVPPAAPGYSLTGRLTDVCFNVPHVIPPTPTTPLALCTWSLTSVPGTHPASHLNGHSILNGLGQVGRVTGGTGIWKGAFSLLPNQTTFTNLAPRTQADTFNFFLP